MRLKIVMNDVHRISLVVCIVIITIIFRKRIGRVHIHIIGRGNSWTESEIEIEIEIDKNIIWMNTKRS